MRWIEDCGYDQIHELSIRSLVDAKASRRCDYFGPNDAHRAEAFFPAQYCCARVCRVVA